MTKLIREQVGNIARYILITIVIMDSFFVFASYRTAQAVTQNMQNSVIEERVFSDLKDAECGQRGFLYTGNEEYLPQYYVGAASTKADMIVLKEYLNKQSDSKPVLDLLSKEIDAKLSELSATVDAFRSGRPDEAKQIVTRGDGLRQTERIRTLIHVLRAQHRDALRRQKTPFGW